MKSPEQFADDAVRGWAMTPTVGDLADGRDDLVNRVAAAIRGYHEGQLALGMGEPPVTTERLKLIAIRKQV